VQSTDTKLRIHVYGHESADPLSVAQAFSGTYSQEVHSQSDLAIFVVNPATGIDQNTIDMWQGFDEYQVPRMVVVTQLEKSEADFDDAVMLANRVFDQVITPYLVLHDDQGLPVALISLADLRIVDYSTNPPKEIDCQEEHRTLVQEFRAEYLEKFESDGENSFAAGLQFPAIPLWIDKGIGVDKVRDLIKQLVI
jgi:translation elongation factor EF-G